MAASQDFNEDDEEIDLAAQVMSGQTFGRCVKAINEGLQEKPKFVGNIAKRCIDRRMKWVGSTGSAPLVDCYEAIDANTVRRPNLPQK